MWRVWCRCRYEDVFSYALLRDGCDDGCNCSKQLQLLFTDQLLLPLTVPPRSLTNFQNARLSLFNAARLQESKNEAFQLKDFFDRLNAIGNIPISLGNWEMTGMEDEVKRIVNGGG